MRESHPHKHQPAQSVEFRQAPHSFLDSRFGLRVTVKDAVEDPEQSRRALASPAFWWAVYYATRLKTGSEECTPSKVRKKHFAARAGKLAWTNSAARCSSCRSCSISLCRSLAKASKPPYVVQSEWLMRNIW